MSDPLISEPWGLHWFRRDLRVAGNPGLRQNWKRHRGRVLGLFCFDSKFLERADFSHHRFAFFLKTLKALRQELQQQGGDLLVIDCLPQEAFPRLLNAVKIRPSLITWCRDYEPFARQRDETIATLLKNEGVAAENFRDHLLLEPHEVLKGPGDFYQVYSPYARKWFSRLTEPEVQSRLSDSAEYFARIQSGRLEKIFRLTWKEVKHPFKDAYDAFEQANAKHLEYPIPEAGFNVAYQQLQSFARRIEEYKEQRNFPAQPGTSRLSIYLKNGSLVSSQILHALKLGQIGFLNGPARDGAAQFTKEIVWREFYYSILFHRPDVESGSFLPKYRNLAWGNDQDLFTRWCQGTTGFPIVDAGMRELNTTGWMHNRLRMIVASFLTKDLLIDWRWGENYFMKMLLDGDLAPNNGGWQWAASTGSDPQPYFRIFNPWLQSKKFDPEGTYIKRYLPELRDLPVKALHDPEAARGPKYPRPVVEHEQQRHRALALYK